MESDKHDTPMRVLHVLGGLNFGGAETMVMNLYRNIDRRRIQFDFVIHTQEKCDYEDEILSLGGKIYRFPRFRGYNVFQYIREWKLFFQHHEEYRIIHGHMRSTASIYLLIAKRQGRYTIAHSHNVSNGTGVAALVKNIMQLPIRSIADSFFACSEAAGEWLFGKKSVSGTRFYIIPNSIDVHKFAYNVEKREKLREAYNLQDQWVIGNVARFHRQKNHEFMIRLFAALKEQYPDAKLVLVGDGKTKGRIVQLIEKSGLQDNVLILAPTLDVAGIMQMLDVFILPSEYEGFGMVAVEAQLAGLPVICSKNVPGDVKISENIAFLPLDDTEVWKDKLRACRSFSRTAIDINEQALQYDSSKTAGWLIDFYLNCRQ